MPRVSHNAQLSRICVPHWLYGQTRPLGCPP
jgi:hypothetical protein